MPLVVILSDRLWRRFHADAAIVWRSIRMNGEPYDVIGVMPLESEEIGDTAEAWVPMGFTPAQLAMFDEFYLDAYARIAPGSSIEQVRDEFKRVAASLAI